ncbi:MAG: uncharacterized protein QOE93_1986, partial [Actinomycetota bacterium]|nr:uncharacterized protein [Actinomycetota bacterium]
RLVMPTANFPTLEPVSFAVVEGELVVAARPGSAGDAVAEGTLVIFEADVLDHEARQGWSVVVKGRVEDLDADVAELVRPALTPWRAGPRDRLMVVRSDWITGQRIVSEPLVALPEKAAPAFAPGPAGLPVVSGRELASGEALRLLQRGEERVGRLAISLSGDPLVFPLNYAVDGDAIVFRTQVGTKLSGVSRSLATFEVDHIDASGQGWSVTFEGLAQEVLDSDAPDFRSRIEALALESWPGGDRPHLVRITPYAVRGTGWTAAEVATGTAGLVGTA